MHLDIFTAIRVILPTLKHYCIGQQYTKVFFFTKQLLRYIPFKVFENSHKCLIWYFTPKLAQVESVYAMYCWCLERKFEYVSLFVMWSFPKNCLHLPNFQIYRHFSCKYFNTEMVIPYYRPMFHVIYRYFYIEWWIQISLFWVGTLLLYYILIDTSIPIPICIDNVIGGLLCQWPLQ